MSEPVITKPPSRLPKWLPWAAIVLAAVLVTALLNPIGRIRDAFFDPDVKAGPGAVVEIRETSELQAATGTFSVPVYLKGENQSALGRLLPDALNGEQVVAIYQGDVNATIDLRGLSENDVVADEETKSLTITVPEPTLTKPNIDEAKTDVIVHSRGAFTRLNDAISSAPLDTKKELDAAANEALTNAAQESDLMKIARRNGESFLTSLGHSMGYDTITVKYRESPS